MVTGFAIYLLVQESNYLYVGHVFFLNNKTLGKKKENKQNTEMKKHVFYRKQKWLKSLSIAFCTRNNEGGHKISDYKQNR